MLKTPVLFLVFNRPDRTRLVFNEIKKQKPEKLFVHADGPRPEVNGDKQKCAEVRKIIDEQIDWKCEVVKLYRDENLGCGRGPHSAISWFFNFVEEGIIIEDDCVPHEDFFGYCTELLQRYRNDERIMVIGGTTYRDDYPCNYSYTFTIYGTMAAWATWRRTWKDYDFNLSFIKREELKLRLNRYLISRFEKKKWLSLYDWMINDGISDYWDWQLQFLMFWREGIAIRPKQNMIRNIGIGNDATHTITSSTEIFTSDRPVYGCLPLSHPPFVRVNKRRDSRHFRKMYGATTFHRIKKIFEKLLKRIRLLVKA